MNKTFLLVVCVLATSAVVAAETLPVDKEARRAQMRQEAEAHFTEADRNRDGKLNYAEWEAARQDRMREQFAKLDSNKDGHLTQDEMRQAHQQRHQMRSARRQEMGVRREKLRALDTNQDQALSRAEIGDQMPRLSENFDRIDSNRDGKLSREEIRASRESMRAQKR